MPIVQKTRGVAFVLRITKLGCEEELRFQSKGALAIDLAKRCDVERWKGVTLVKVFT